MFLGILNPDFKVESLNLKTLESGEFCFVNDFLLNPDIFLDPACELLSLR